jgi:alkanesulfonate monooxygenase SsuD/methylene tetrahydromethanopterin reductase-like flavin-dependent oxidoreductase (luciferase family)
MWIAGQRSLFVTAHVEAGRTPGFSAIGNSLPNLSGADGPRPAATSVHELGRRVVGLPQCDGHHDACQYRARTAHRGASRRIPHVGHPGANAVIRLHRVLVAMALAAVKTSLIRLGIGVLIPSNRIGSVTANTLASLNKLAPGCIDLGIGTGFTGRNIMGLGAMRLADLRE